MKAPIELARKKVVVLAACVCMYSFLLTMLPATAVRHGLPAVWAVIPLIAIEVVALVFLLIAARELQTLKKSGGSHGLR
jgi:hypothetical protein